MTPGAVRRIEIGSLSVPTNLFLAPMSGVTDCAFRCLVRACSGSAVGLAVSEFVAAEGLTRDNPKTLRMLRYQESERPVSIQIFGADACRMARAARMVEDVGADVVDINCGCPAPKVVRRGGGAELMRQHDRLRDVLRSVRRAVAIPVTVKIRAGWDDRERNALEVAKIVEGEGASMLAIHGRTRMQMYRGQADWHLVASIRAKLGIPVIGSGDLRSPESIVDRLTSGSCDGVMIGRAAMDNPWIFAQVAALAAGLPLPVAAAEDRLRALVMFRVLLKETLSDRALMGRLRGMACRLIKGMRSGATARRAIGRAATADEVEAIFADFLLGRGGLGAGPEDLCSPDGKEITDREIPS